MTGVYKLLLGKDVLNTLSLIMGLKLFEFSGFMLSKLLLPEWRIAMLGAWDGLC